MAGDTDDIDAAAEDIASLDEGYMERNHVEVNHNYDDSETASVTSFTLSDTAELSSDTEGISVTGAAHNAKPNDKVTVTVGGWYSEHEAGAESVNFSLDIDGAEQVVTGEDGKKELVFPLLAEVPKPAWASNYSSFKVVFFDSDGEEEELVSSAGGDAIYFVTDSVGDFSISGKDLSSKSGSLKNVLSEEEKKLLEDSNASSTSKNEVLKKISQQIAKNVEDVSGNSVQLTDTAVMGRKGGKYYLLNISTNRALVYDGRAHEDDSKNSKGKSSDIQVKVSYYMADSAIKAADIPADKWTVIPTDKVKAKIKNAKNATVDLYGDGTVAGKKSAYISDIKVDASVTNAKEINAALKKVLKKGLVTIKSASSTKYSDADSERTLSIPIYPAFAGINDGVDKADYSIADRVTYTVNKGKISVKENKVKSVKNYTVKFGYKDGSKGKTEHLKYSNNKNKDFVKDAVVNNGAVQMQLRGNYYGFVTF